MDFNTDSIVTAKAKNLLPITILERQEGLIDSWEWYYKDNQSTKSERLIKARLHSLHLKIKDQFQEMLEQQDDWNKYCELIKSDSPDDWEKATNHIFTFLYNIGLTKMTVSKRYDATLIEEENEAFGL